LFRTIQQYYAAGFNAILHSLFETLRKRLPGNHPPGFDNLPWGAFLEGSTPIVDEETNMVLFPWVPELERQFSAELWRHQKERVKIKDRTNYQIVIPDLDKDSDGYKSSLKNLLHQEERRHPIATTSVMTYSNDTEARVTIENAQPVKTVYIVASPVREKDFAMINNIAGHYKITLGAKRIVLIAPFLGFAREDKNAKLNPDGSIKLTNQVITIASRMREISQSVDNIIVLEPHSGATQTWAAEYGIPLLPISMWKLMTDKVITDLKGEEGFNKENLLLIRPDKGRNLAALRIEEFLDIEGVSLNKDRDPKTGKTTFKALNKGQRKTLKGKDSLIYDDEGASLGTMKGVVASLISSQVKSINIMLGHPRFTGEYRDEKGWHDGWKENLEAIIKQAEEARVKIKFYISNSRKPIGNIFKYANDHQDMFQIVDVSLLIKRLIEADTADINFWQDDKWKRQVAQPYPNEVDKEV